MTLCKTFNYLLTSVRSLYKVQGIEKITRSYYSPFMNEQEVQEVQNVIGLHMTYNSLSWARYQISNNEITHLNLQMFPIDIRKFDLNLIYSVAEQIIETLPVADKYCIESFQKQVGGITGKVHLTLHSTRMQLTSMIVALLNQRSKSRDHSIFCVNFLKPRVCGRLFKILIGTEQVCTNTVVENILTNKDSYKCVPVMINEEIINNYRNDRSPIEQELLGQALLLTLCFVNVALFKNDDVINQILLEREAKGNKAI